MHSKLVTVGGVATAFGLYASSVLAVHLYCDLAALHMHALMSPPAPITHSCTQLCKLNMVELRLRMIASCRHQGQS